MKDQEHESGRDKHERRIGPGHLAALAGVVGTAAAVNVGLAPPKEGQMPIPVEPKNDTSGARTQISEHEIKYLQEYFQFTNIAVDPTDLSKENYQSAHLIYNDLAKRAGFKHPKLYIGDRDIPIAVTLSPGRTIISRSMLEAFSNHKDMWKGVFAIELGHSINFYQDDQRRLSVLKDPATAGVLAGGVTAIGFMAGLWPRKRKDETQEEDGLGALGPKPGEQLVRKAAAVAAATVAGTLAAGGTGATTLALGQTWEKKISHSYHTASLDAPVTGARLLGDKKPVIKVLEWLKVLQEMNNLTLDPERYPSFDVIIRHLETADIGVTVDSSNQKRSR